MEKIYVIHENDAWVEPLREAFDELSLPFQEWFLAEGLLDFSATPPEGVFYNRISASSHTRGHRYAPEYAACVLAWLERHRRRVVNNGRALQLEMSKIAQYAALDEFSIRTPHTMAAVGADHIIAAARSMRGSFVTKHNRAGTGLRVRLFHDVASLESYVRSSAFEESVDGVTLVQEYIRAPDPFITRVEFVGGRFLYAVRVETTLGLEIGSTDVREAGGATSPAGESPRFQVLEDYRPPIVERYQRFLAANGIEIAGIEFLTDASGEVYTYDVNTNTNYNPAAEAEAGKHGMKAIAKYLGRELNQRYGRLTRAA